MPETNRRLFDIAGSICLLVISSPILLTAAVAVGLTSTGPVFFSQTRLGRNGRPFRILKFRTMFTSRTNGPAITVAGDNRITPVGKLLRRMKIDELPQLINVLKGDMSLVGPRPEVPQYRHVYRQGFDEVLESKPGITDPVSLALVNEEEFLGQFSDPLRAYEEILLPQKLALSLSYLKQRRLRDDLLLILSTGLAAAGIRRTETSHFHRLMGADQHKTEFDNRHVD